MFHFFFSRFFLCRGGSFLFFSPLLSIFYGVSPASILGRILRCILFSYGLMADLVYV
jgi:hypothetical protein